MDQPGTFQSVSPKFFNKIKKNGVVQVGLSWGEAWLVNSSLFNLEQSRRSKVSCIFLEKRNEKKFHTFLERTDFLSKQAFLIFT